MNINDQDPDKDRQLNPAGKPPLSEKDFIRNGWSLTSLPFWLWLFLLSALALIILGSQGTYQSFINKEKSNDPFLEVTNRDFSLFLWQFPSYMRVNSSRKIGYLPGFLSTNANFNLNAAEEFVSAPPDLLFLYHTWHRLIGSDFIPRPIYPNEFDDFLQQLPEWQPNNWKNGPKEYNDLIHSKSYAQINNLQTLSESTLPLKVRQAFQGWKNYFIEGAKINEIRPTVDQVNSFLKAHPHYARNYWRNIQEVYGQEVAGLKYLYALQYENLSGEAQIPAEQLAPFLKVALFNAEQATQNQ